MAQTNMIKDMYGYPLIISSGAVEEVLKISKREWKERWFTFPLRPFNKLKSSTYMRPCMYMAMEKIIMHPALENKFMEEIWNNQ